MFPYENRIKSIQSCVLKHNKYYPSREVEKVFNDILGIRIIVSEYSAFKISELPKEVSIVDMTGGKANDDGYRGMHIHYQKDHVHYPIEIQLMTSSDQIFNEWLHAYVYKYVNCNNVDALLGIKYEKGQIETLDDFRKELRNVLSDCKKA